MSGSSTAPELHLAKTTVAIQSSPLRSQQCPMGFHKVDETSDVGPKETRDEDDHVHGRHVDHGQKPIRSQEEHGSVDTVCWSRLPSQPEEECTLSNKAARISGVQSEHQQHDYIALSSDKLHSIQKLSRKILDQKTSTVQELARLLRMMVAAHPAILPAPCTTDSWRL